jgi:hypothetical protein
LQQQSQQQKSTSGTTSQLSLPQVIDVYGRRILHLEKTVSGITTGSIAVPSVSATPVTVGSVQPVTQQSGPVIDKASVEKLVISLLDNRIKTQIEGEVRLSLAATTEEWNARYELLAQEIAELKDIVLHLQEYTMTVNKRLLEGAVEASVAAHIHEQILKHTQSSIDELSSTFQGTLLQEDCGNILDEATSTVQSQVNDHYDSSDDAETAEDLRYLQSILEKTPEEYEINPGMVGEEEVSFQFQNA